MVRRCTVARALRTFARMEILTAGQQEMIAQALGGLPAPVALLYYTPDAPSAVTLIERLLLEAIARASDRVALEVLADRWSAAREATVGIARTPAIVVRSAKDYGIRYYGAPDGYELETFVSVIRAVSEGRSGLSEASRARLAALRAPLHLETLVSPT